MNLFLLSFIYIYFNIFVFIVFISINIENCISLVIPATILSWKKCNIQIEKMICNSVEAPMEIIIVISGSNYSRKEVFLTYCKRKIFLYYRMKQKNSASNKNYGSKLSNCNYISYFDSDDIMSPYRISVLKYIIKHFKEYDIILHMYTRKYSELQKINFSLKKIQLNFYLNSSYVTFLYKKNIKNHKIELWGCCHFLPKALHISNGWITIKKSMFLSEQFNEDISIKRAEDSEYNGRVISKGYKALILTMILGFYSKQNVCNLF